MNRFFIIISILVALGMRGFTKTRSNQSLVLAEQELRSILLQAQQMAVNEVRNQDCIRQAQSRAGSDPALLHAAERRCSDIGVALQWDKLLLFADTDSQNDNQYTEGQDFILEERTLPQPVFVSQILLIRNPEKISLYSPPPPAKLGGSAPAPRLPAPLWHSILFEGIPPSFTVFVDRGRMDARVLIQILLRAGRDNDLLWFNQYGILQQARRL